MESLNVPTNAIEAERALKKVAEERETGTVYAFQNVVVKTAHDILRQAKSHVVNDVHYHNGR